MSIQRTPERRGRRHSGVWFSALVVAALIVAVLIVYFMGVADPLLGKGGPPEDLQPSAQSQPTPTPPPPSPTPAAAETPGPEQGLQPTPVPRVTPQVDFGEVLAEGWVDLTLPGGAEADTWYTYQVDTSNREITLFFALYNDSDSAVSTVRVDGYTRQSPPNNAEITLYYPDGSKRVILFEEEGGKLTDTQEYRFKPHEPSIFSPGLRSNLVFHQVPLQDAAGNTTAEINRDLSGLLASETIVFERSAPAIVERALGEIGLLVNQIEDKRPQ